VPAPTVSRDQAIDALFATFRDNGYGGATLSELSRGTGLGRSSLYHHFPGGKEDMAGAVLDRAETFLKGMLEAAVAAEGPPRERLAKVLGTLEALYAGGKNPCVLANFAQGEARTLFQRRLRFLFELWIDGLSDLARQAGVPEREARERAEDAVGAIEGALIVAAGLNDAMVFRRRLGKIPSELFAGAPV
jgi:AcrR family transcriptional regulator